MSPLWRQVLAISPVYCLQVCYGMSSAYPAIVTPQLMADCSDFTITSDQESWIGFLQQKFGPRLVLMMTCLPYLLGWALAALAWHYHSVWLLYISRLCVGAGHGLVSSSIYTVEVVQKELRASLSVFEGVTRSVGMILTYSLAAFLPWHSVSYIGSAALLAAFALLLNSPESPVFLVSKGKLDQAESSLKKLYTEQFDAEKEIKEIKIGLEKFNEDTSNQQRKKSEVLRNITNYPDVYKPFLIITLLSFVQQFSGATVIRGYVVKMFGDIFQKETVRLVSGNLSVLCNCGCKVGPPLPQSAYIAAIIIGVTRMISSLRKADILYRRRTLYLLSGCFTIISLALFSTTLLLEDKLTGSHSVLTWLSLTSASSLVFSANLGIQPLPLLLSSELYPPELRATCKGVSRSVTCLLIVISLKMFPILVNSLQMFGCFFLYCGVVIVALPPVMLSVPETKDLSLSQINFIFRRVEK